MAHLHIKYYKVIRKNKVMRYAYALMNIEGIMLSEMSKKEL